MLVAEIAKLPGVEVICQPTINQGLVRFLDCRASASDADHDRRTDQVIGAVAIGGEALFGGTTWRGRRAMRVSVCNWRTSQRDVTRTVASIAAVLRQTN
jgi:glutamate/tyrosine decarboxylase-like PLP-dependent enzyme